LRSLCVAQLQARDLRNLARVDADFGPRFNVISGENGQGKTNLLEAIYLVATSKSFRSSRASEIVSFGAEVASVRATIVEDDTSRVQSVGLKHGARAVKIDDKRPPSLAEYALRTPIVVFHPGEIALSMGGSAERRKLLDRTALYSSPKSLAEHDAYTRATKARQRILETRGAAASDLDDWETLVVRHGIALMHDRARAAELLATSAKAAFSRIAAPGLVLSVAYAPSAPFDEGAFRAALVARRSVDLRRGSSGVGPHRDDLALAIGEHPVRGIASQGQHRAVTLALKSAEIDVVGTSRGVRPILLLDDVSSELDRARTAALFAFLRDQRGQVFLTTTRPELIDTGDDRSARADFTVSGGSLTRSA
jgi:DNA replication and repair protein RecF